jgi:tetratricopeptide (TPR) repeat protein
VARAEGLLSAGFAGEALEDARAGVTKDPGSLLALVVAAEAEEQLLNLDEARRDAESVGLRAQPRHWKVAARARRVLARIAATTGLIKEAHEHAKAALALDDQSIEGRLLRGEIELDPSFEEQFLDDAETAFKNVLRQRPSSIDAKKGQALVQLVRNVRQPERARRKLEDAFNEDQRDPWALEALGRMNEDQQQPDRAKPFRRAAARMERDVRRLEGLYYALGLRDEKLAREATGPAQAAHVERALAAYRRATWLDPLHSQGLTGLASIAFDQGAKDRTDKAIKKALAVNALSVQTLVLQARALATRDVLRAPQGGAGAAIDAVAKALERRGETAELLALRAFLTPREQPSQPTDPLVKLDLAFKRFDEVRAKDPASPWSLEDLRLEREMISALQASGGAQNPFATEEAKAKLNARDDGLRALQNSLGGVLDAADKLHDELAVKVEAELGKRGGSVEEADAMATQITRKAPWRAKGWHLLSRTRARKGDAWGALAADLRAAHIDDAYAIGLFDLLRTASGSPDLSAEPLARAAERMLLIDSDALPFDEDMKVLLRSAPQVAKALKQKVDADVGKRTLEALETLVNADPTQLTPQVLMGVLCYGADQDDLAIQHLLFVGTVREDAEAGQAWYLAAVVIASQSAPDLVTATEWLDHASTLGFQWKEKGTVEPRLEALRKSPLWQRLF